MRHQKVLLSFRSKGYDLDPRASHELLLCLEAGEHRIVSRLVGLLPHKLARIAIVYK